jgi:hypothetical protein
MEEDGVTAKAAIVLAGCLACRFRQLAYLR